MVSNLVGWRADLTFAAGRLTRSGSDETFTAGQDRKDRDGYGSFAHLSDDAIPPLQDSRLDGICFQSGGRPALRDLENGGRYAGTGEGFADLARRRLWSSACQFGQGVRNGALHLVGGRFSRSRGGRSGCAWDPAGCAGQRLSAGTAAARGRASGLGRLLRCTGGCRRRQRPLPFTGSKYRLTCGRAGNTP